MSTNDSGGDDTSNPKQPEQDEDDAESFDVRDELDEAFGQPTVRRTGGHWTTNEDELPTPIIESDIDDAVAPPFLRENQVCIEDKSEFVLRDGWGRTMATFSPDEVTNTGSEAYAVRCWLARERLGLPSEPARNAAPTPAAVGLAIAGVFVSAAGAALAGAFGSMIVTASLALLGALVVLVALRGMPREPRSLAVERQLREHLEDCGTFGRYRGYGRTDPFVLGDLVAVEPVRPSCRYLVRQLMPPTPSEAASGHIKYGWMHRYCSARRTVTGAFMDLSDSAMRACSIREPYDVPSYRLVRQFDEKKEEASRSREHTPLFNLLSESLGFTPDKPNGEKRP